MSGPPEPDDGGGTIGARCKRFAALDPAVALAACTQIPGEAFVTCANLLAHPTTEANAIERLAAIPDTYFNPAPELCKLPPDGVKILLKKWVVVGLNDGTLAEQHAQVLLTRNATFPQTQQLISEGGNVSGYGKASQEFNGKKGAGQLYWCKFMKTFYVGKTPQQHRATPAYDTTVRQQLQVAEERKKVAEERLEQATGVVQELRDAKRAADDATMSESSKRQQMQEKAEEESRKRRRMQEDEKKRFLAAGGEALEYASEELRADRDFMLAVVAKDIWGRALEYASEGLRADRKVVLAAVAKNSR
eukprot:COSAG01_NODE_8820_length_2649_cov_2.457255_1_plen_304_part_10